MLTTNNSTAATTYILKSETKGRRRKSKITQELRQSGTKEKQIPKTGKVIKSKNLLGSDKMQSPAKLTKTVKSVMKSSVVSRVKKSKKR